MTFRYRTLLLVLPILISCGHAGPKDSTEYLAGVRSAVSISSLSDLTVETLRSRKYGSSIQIVDSLGSRAGGSEYSNAYGATGSGPYDTFMASYVSDGLRLYTRIDIPNTPMPDDGYPVVIFCHGWVGIDAAPTFHFSYTPESMYAELIDAYVDAGLVVLTPGYRGHGAIDGVAADGINFMAVWDNGSYVSPVFYAIDVLNLLDGAPTLNEIDWRALRPGQKPVKINRHRIHISGHSQGGDVALIALAVAGEGSNVSQSIASGAISDGTFADRFTQAETYGPMQKSPEAFMSGDGGWSGTALGRDGSVNPNFVFGYPADWIETPERENWTWQTDTWSAPTVVDAIAQKYREMYAALNEYVGDIEGAVFQIKKVDGDRYEIEHDPSVTAAMRKIGAFRQEAFLKKPLILHYSDRDFYSLPEWNEDLCARINDVGGNCVPFLYSGNSHLMRASNRQWFSPDGTMDSYSYIASRDIALFSGEDPTAIEFPQK